MQNRGLVVRGRGPAIPAGELPQVVELLTACLPDHCSAHRCRDGTDGHCSAGSNGDRVDGSAGQTSRATRSHSKRGSSQFSGDSSSGDFS
jgi:hypothetical protein